MAYLPDDDLTYRYVRVIFHVIDVKLQFNSSLS